MLDRWAFGMSKIDGGASASASAAASGPGSLTSPPTGQIRESSADVKIHAIEMDQASERIAQLLREPGFGEKNTLSSGQKPPGPSLLSQQAPPLAHPTSAPPMPTDGSDETSLEFSTAPSSSGTGSSMALDPQSAGLEAVDRITVKIADLGNGEALISRNCLFVR
jgi:serine/threonine-protein kinase SRPK3